jgi:glutathione peroxidase
MRTTAVAALLLAMGLAVPVATAGAGTQGQKGGGVKPSGIYAFTMKTIDGQDRPLSEYRGRALLIVNTASKCGFTPQYRAMEALYQRYRKQGLEVLAFPANNFMGQEPGTDREIREFCTTKYNVTFPMFSKISVKGKDIHPLYAWLTRESGFPGDIKWNFNKFLVDPSGKVVARYDSGTDPLSLELVRKLMTVLPPGGNPSAKK